MGPSSGLSGVGWYSVALLGLVIFLIVVDQGQEKAIEGCKVRNVSHNLDIVS